MIKAIQLMKEYRIQKIFEVIYVILYIIISSGLSN
jgi:hypothetical protein